MTKKRMSFACMVCVIATLNAAELPQAEVTVRVADEETLGGIASAAVRIGFTVPDGRGGTTSKTISGVTDASGGFAVKEQTLPDITIKASKSGYYDSSIHHDLKLTRAQIYDPSKTELTIPLRRVGSPVAMYARKRVRIELPAVNAPVPYDLIAADWLPPHGQGTVGDLIFVVNRQDQPLLSTVVLRFSNQDDGIQSVLARPYEGSVLRLPRMAPEGGYQNELRLGPGQDESETRDRNYFYRVRTVKKDGRIVRALYGKIHGEIDFDTINSKTAIVLFTYYLNPDGSRNVEFDPTKNLFNHLTVVEQVHEP